MTIGDAAASIPQDAFRWLQGVFRIATGQQAPPGPPAPPGAIGPQQWWRPSIHFGGFLSCPGGYDLIHVGVEPEILAFTCQLKTTPIGDRFPLRLPPANDVVFGLPPL